MINGLRSSNNQGRGPDFEITRNGETRIVEVKKVVPHSRSIANAAHNAFDQSPDVIIYSPGVSEGEAARAEGRLRGVLTPREYDRQVTIWDGTGLERIIFIPGEAVSP